ncbi:Serine protease precursor MucD/AlgY associated with sigma factor RpoE [gamma proteobacterium IMCC2047]|nr:Serine protease precursor MucD/AlgY associated with sigma factor RpoE [gamma proteobacterium IMCC2047]
MLVLTLFQTASADNLTDTLAKVKPSIVGVGTYQPTRAPQSRLQGTGFAVADGYHVVTNAHVVKVELAVDQKEVLVIFTGKGKRAQFRQARVLVLDEAHDLALLRISGTRLPPLKMADSEQVREGERYAFTGFPLGGILGLYPATHQGIVSSITPIAAPMGGSRQLTPELIKRLRNGYEIFQLDATAYPGNSGSPLYDQVSGQVVGVINSVFVKGTKEAAIGNPSGITYAIPSRYVRKLLEKIKSP